MWLSDKKYLIKSELLPEEILKRIKGVTEEPDDLLKVVPMNIYKFKGTVSSERINLRVVDWAYKSPLTLNVTINKENPVEISIIRYFARKYKIMNITFVIFFLLMILDWSQKSVFGAITILGICLIFYPILSFLGSTIERRKIYRIFNFINSKTFNYEQTKYQH